MVELHPFFIALELPRGLLFLGGDGVLQDIDRSDASGGHLRRLDDMEEDDAAVKRRSEIGGGFEHPVSDRGEVEQGDDGFHQKRGRPALLAATA